ncbi:type II toxin-antitoxin system death-on-curing family toxin [Roseibacillus persicicus]|uniref:type II toxin-antitoxin system death-on-curing family toxin n=1 Tax=Roseibacillus persicicus TaxID=454148 RepID=UPI00398B7B17
MGQPQQLFHYEKANLFQLAASYAHGIVKNRPFADGNKRTGFMAAYVFLRMNGQALQAPEVEAVTHTLGLAASTLTKQDYANWLEKSCEAQ